MALVLDADGGQYTKWWHHNLRPLDHPGLWLQQVPDDPLQHAIRCRPNHRDPWWRVLGHQAEEEGTSSDTALYPTYHRYRHPHGGRPWQGPSWRVACWVLPHI